MAQRLTRQVLALGGFTVALILCCSACERGGVHGQEGGPASTVIFKHGKIQGDPSAFRSLLERFQTEHPGIKVKDETLPSSTDEQHQFYVINLEGQSTDFDVLSMDVIWVPEFARAGWLKDLSHLLSQDEMSDFFSAPIKAVSYENRIYAVPWYIDAGVLYYRKDLLRKYGFSPPRTWYELIGIAQHITAREADLYGFIWQGKQYEGLVCNALEYIWSNRGEVLDTGGPVIDSPENVIAMALMRNLIAKYKITPPLVTTAMEEPTRHIFGNGRALFMRNWPYAWNIFEQPGSPVEGKVGVSPLPCFPGGKSASTLGGWQLGINRFSPRQESAERLIRFLTSPESQKTLALTVGYKPTRMSLYKDPELREKQPFIAGLFDVFMNARPRPVSPYYMIMTQVMQPEFSSIVSGIKSPGACLKAANAQIRYILEAEK
jgi:multiple sugar transport system substrate-binding protein